MSNSNKTIIIVPGAWHGPEHFDHVAKKLEAEGYKTVGIHLKTVHKGEPEKDFWPDVKLIQSEIKKAADAGHDVIIVAHSYGGIPASQAIEGFDRKTRESAGQPGGVTRLVYAASFVIPEDKTLIGAFGGDLPWFDINAERTVVNPMGPEDVFYNDLPEDLVKKCVASLRPFSYQAMHSELKWAAWKHGVPTTYIYTTKDQAIPLHIQHMMVEQFAQDYHIDTEEVDASHSPFYSKADELTAAIRRAAGESV